MLIDSHCHLDRIDLKPYEDDFSCFITAAKANQLEHLLCIAIDLESYPAMLDLFHRNRRASKQHKCKVIYLL